MNISSKDNLSAKTVFCVLNAVSVLVCLLASLTVLGLKLYRKIVYRLSLYQVLSALAFSTVETLQIIFVNYDEFSAAYRRLCTFVGMLEVYTEWVKLLFTMWVTVHLFCFVVLDKNLKQLEVLYVVISLIVPAVIAAVPLITQSYRIEPLGCYISDANGTDSAADVELFALWNVPALILLSAASVAMVVMVTSIFRKVCHRQNHEPLIHSDPYWKVLRHLLPLAAFPVLFFIFVIPVLVFDINVAGSPVRSEGATIAGSVFIALWSMASGATVIVHIAVVRLYCRGAKRPSKEKAARRSSCGPTVGDEINSFVNINSSTYASLASESMSA